MGKRLLVIMLLLALILAAGAVLSAPNSLNVSWWTVDGGGAAPELNGGSYSLQGTTGQADAGAMGNGRYTLNGGYWNNSVTNPVYAVYLPVVVKP
jgi:hypothetical protein